MAAEGPHRPRTAIVTGGSGAIDASVARLLASEGATVVIADVRDAEGTELTAELGGRARNLHLDVSEEDGWRQAVAPSTGSEFVMDGGLLAGPPTVLNPIR